MSFNSPKSWKRILRNIWVFCSRLEKNEKRTWRFICDKIVFAEKLCGKERSSTKLVFRCSTQKTDYHSQVEWASEFSSKKCISKRKPPDTLFPSAGWTYSKRFIETSSHTGISFGTLKGQTPLEAKPVIASICSRRIMLGFVWKTALNSDGVTRPSPAIATITGFSSTIKESVFAISSSEQPIRCAVCLTVSIVSLIKAIFSLP